MGRNEREPERGEQRPASDRALGLRDDGLYRALAATPRRRLLCLLLDDHKQSLEELATVLVGWQATERETLSTAEERDRLRLSLRHVHLPLLDELGLVDYHRESETVTLKPLDEPLRELLRRSVERPADA